MPKSNQKKTFTLNKDVRTSVGVLIAGVILILIIYFLIRPLFNDSQSIKREISANQNLLTQLKQKEVQLNQAHQNYDQISSSSAIINEAMPNYSNVALVARIIEKLDSEVLENQLPLIIEGFSVGPVPNDLPDEDYSSTWQKEAITINISLTGTYSAIRDFILQLKSLRHNFSVDQITINNASNASTSQFLGVNISLKYYYFE